MSQHNSNYESKLDDISHTKTNRILHDIRNMKLLCKDQIATIHQMTHQEKMEVIMAYCAVMENINEIVNNM